jgi:hypothetical protein
MPCMRLRLPPGDMVGEGARRGVMGGARRSGDERAAMTMTRCLWRRERRGGHEMGGKAR